MYPHSHNVLHKHTLRGGGQSTSSQTTESKTLVRISTMLFHNIHSLWNDLQIHLHLLGNSLERTVQTTEIVIVSLARDTKNQIRRRAIHHELREILDEMMMKMMIGQ